MIFTLNRDKSRRLIEGLSEAAIIVRGATVTMSNAPARNLLGVAIEGVDVRQVLPHPAVVDRLVRGRINGPEEVEAAGFGRSRRQWLVRIAPLGDGDLLVRLIDRSEARAAEQMRVDFVANASHELRTPLSTLIGYAETLRERTGEIDDDTRIRFMSIVHEEAQRMKRVVEDLISLSRIEAEKFTTPTEAVDLEQLIDVAMESARRIAEERQSELDLHRRSGSSGYRCRREPNSAGARQSHHQCASLRRARYSSDGLRIAGRRDGPSRRRRSGRGHSA